MKTPTTLILTLAALVCIGTVPVSASGEGRLDAFERGEVAIETAAGRRHVFRVYLATSRRQLAQGLMHVRALDEDVGMLFRFHPPRPSSMWMKNTFIPLDMLFIRPNGSIAKIANDAVPGSLESIDSDAVVAGVLELNAGTAARLRLQPGDRVVHRFFTD